ncbi:MAG: response regulator, partial [Desulfobacteraceae bacterium]
TAYGREEVLKEAKEIGLDGYISKPISTSTLLDRIMDALGGKNHDRKEIRFEPGSPVIDITQIAGAKILVVEDNEFNRQVASELLQSIGLNVTLAENGKVALDLVQREEFHAILMDIQMPEMDGLTAARNIRKLGTKSSTIPIIALTAHAMIGDREKSLAAGMNDHVTKPLDPEELFTTLMKWLIPMKKHDIFKKEIVTDDSSRSDKNMMLPDLPGIDVRAGMNRIGGKIDTFIKLAKKFAEGQSGIVEDITNAMEAGDKETAVRYAHTLKGSAGNLGAVELNRAASDLEKLLKDNGASDEWRTQTELVSTLLNEVLSGIWSLGHTAEIIDQSDITNNQNESEPDLLDITKALVKMKHLLDENSFRAAKHINTLYSLLQGTPVEEELYMLKKRLDNYDFNGAMDIVNNIGAVLNISLEEN